MYSCARICVEMDLEKGLREAVQIKIDEWSFRQTLNYEQIPFKCSICHDHGHFTKNCPKSQQYQPPPIAEPEIKTVTSKRRKPQHKGLPQPTKP